MTPRWARVRDRRWDLLLVAGFILSFALARAGKLAERDPYWQIRAGAENLAGLPLARPDTWTWSGVPGDWYPNSPLWNILLAISYEFGRYWGVFGFTVLLLLLLFAMGILLAGRLGARPLPGLLAVFAVFAGALPYLGARATLGAQVLMMVAVYTGVVLSERADRLPVPVLVGITTALATSQSILGNWTHLSFLLVGPGLAAVWAVIWLLTPALTPKRKTLLILGGGAGWVLGPLLSPYGLAGGLARARAVQDSSQGLLTEWMSPLDPAQGGQWDTMVVVAMLAAAGASWWLWQEWRQGRDVRLVAALTMIGVPASLAGLFALRFLGIGPVTLAPVLAVLATDAIDRFRRGVADRQVGGRLGTALQDYTAGRFWRVTLSIVLVALSPVVLILAAEHAAPREHVIIDRVPTGCRVFSSPAIAGVVVLLRPDAPVWIDGRSDFFGRDVIHESIAYYKGSLPAAVPERTGCVVLDPDDELTSGLRTRLTSSGQWHLAETAAGFELWLPGPDS